ncbi:Bromodomain-containing protein [Favolaschia claudopus]|uniref:Bromodomain-containing protein n=1 Tax=Favolaschia claudopus TaxID=2862362 RepID=A0AAV9Z3U0_9AGAR
MATPPPSSAPNGAALAPPRSRFKLDAGQWRYSEGRATISTLYPVDPDALGIPHYSTIVRSPMDLSTIERKLNSSNPSNDPEHPPYSTADEFIADVRLVVKNCLSFNGIDHPISAMAKRLEEVFDKQIKNLPGPSQSLRGSTSMPIIPSLTTEDPPHDLPSTDVLKQRKSKRLQDGGQLQFCAKLLDILHRKQYQAIASPFYYPVDHVALDIPTYPEVVTNPMDLSTMRQKLGDQEYLNASMFHDDFKLIMRNCFAFNPVGNPVNQAGLELQRLFDEIWQGLPPLPEVCVEEENEDDDESGDDVSRIAMQIRGGRLKTDKKKERRDRGHIASSSKSRGKQSKGGVSKKTKRPIADTHILTFEQKVELSEAVNQLDGPKLERIYTIIREGVPEIRESTEEMELEIDLLPNSVLTKLYNFALRPPATKQHGWR